MSPGRGLPLTAVLGVLIGILVIAATRVTLRDVDLYWHILAGEELASGASPGALGSDWLDAPNPLPWTSTQWLGEWALHLIHELGGWAAIAAFRVLSMALTVAALALTTFKGRSVPAAVGPVPHRGLRDWLHPEERPQQVTFLGAALLGAVLVRGLRNGTVPRWWIVLPLTALWANIHGGWILVPVVLGLISLGRFLDQGIRDASARALALLGLASLATGALSPAGTGNVTVLLRVSSAARGVIAEWGPTVPASMVGSLTVMMLALAILGWTRPGQEVPRSEIVIVLVLVAFAWAAWRNVTPALALLAPVVADRLDRAYSDEPRRREPRWSAPVGIGIAVVCTVVAVSLLPGRDHLPTDRYPVGLAGAISGLPGPQRVLNDYKVAGLVLYFGGESTRVGIDGRTDRYGQEYLTKYLDTLKMAGPWRSTIDDLAPTSALLEADSPVAQYLVLKGWHTAGQEAGYVLLTEPSAG